MNFKTAELSGYLLDWAVAEAEGLRTKRIGDGVYLMDSKSRMRKLFSPSTDWRQGGPIIERERMLMCPISGVDGWSVSLIRGAEAWVAEGPTLLTAAMRMHAAGKFGDTVNVPEELMS